MGLRCFAGLGLVLAATMFVSGCFNSTPRYRQPPLPVPAKGAPRTPANVPSPTANPIPKQGAFNTSSGAPVSQTSGSNFRTVPSAAPTGAPLPGPSPIVPTVYNGPAPEPAPPGPAPTPTVGSNVTITQPPFPAGPAIQPPPPPQ